jgi:putative FmdB family regulatory protein
MLIFMCKSGVYQFNCNEAIRDTARQRFDQDYQGWYNERKHLSREVSLPLYEYRCLECGTSVEKIRKYSDPPLTKCEKCGGKLERLLSSPAFKFKGTGWYVTDYAGKSSPGDKEKIEKEKTDSAASGKSDKAPAEKAKEPLPAPKPRDSKPRSHK